MKRPYFICLFLCLSAFAARPVQAQTETVLHSFTGGSDGGSPAYRLTSDGAGNFYGTTFEGGEEYGVRSVFGNNQISCGNIQSTEWIVQQFKATNQPSGLPLYYCLNSPTTFDPATAQPCQAPPPYSSFLRLTSSLPT